jgi:hypothetical protein
VFKLGAWASGQTELRRELLTNGTPERHIRELFITGLTSNPNIFNSRYSPYQVPRQSDSPAFRPAYIRATGAGHAAPTAFFGNSPGRKNACSPKSLDVDLDREIGSGTQPILTKHCWLIAYHGVSEMETPGTPAVGRKVVGWRADAEIVNNRKVKTGPMDGGSA